MKLQRLNVEPDGNYRVYYKGDNGSLYCWQLDDLRANQWSFYRCSRDGEPSHQVTLEDQPQPPGNPS